MNGYEYVASGTMYACRIIQMKALRGNVPCDLKDCISRHIPLVGEGSEPWGRPMTGLYAKIRRAGSGEGTAAGKTGGLSLPNPHACFRIPFY